MEVTAIKKTHLLKIFFNYYWHFKRDSIPKSFNIGIATIKLQPTTNYLITNKFRYDSHQVIYNYCSNFTNIARS